MVAQTLDRLQEMKLKPFISVTVTRQNTIGLSETVKYLLYLEFRRLTFHSIEIILVHFQEMD